MKVKKKNVFYSRKKLYVHQIKALMGYLLCVGGFPPTDLSLQAELIRPTLNSFSMYSQGQGVVEQSKLSSFSVLRENFNVAHSFNKNCIIADYEY